MAALALSVQGNVAQAGDAAAGKAKTATCAACHGPTGISAVPVNPNLAGQKEQYLAKAMNEYKSGKRDDPTMKAMVGMLSDDDINNIAAFYASQACK
jgi:cytochrome c553